MLTRSEILHLREHGDRVRAVEQLIRGEIIASAWGAEIRSLCRRSSQQPSRHGATTRILAPFRRLDRATDAIASSLWVPKTPAAP